MYVFIFLGKEDNFHVYPELTRYKNTCIYIPVVTILVASRPPQEQEYSLFSLYVSPPQQQDSPVCITTTITTTTTRLSCMYQHHHHHKNKNIYLSV